MSKEFGQSEGFILSSDCVGRYGYPKEIEKVWDFAIREEKFLGVEVVGWKNVIGSFDRLLKDRVKIAGFHGRMGRDKTEALGAKLRSHLLDSNIVSTIELLKKAPEVSYILLHSVSLDKPENKEEALKNGHSTRALLIENHVQKGAMSHALGYAISLREKGVNAGIMIDIVHYFYENSIKPEDMSKQWSNMLSAVKMTIKEAKTADPKMPVGIHLPVGTRMVDSLLMDHITSAQWKKLADVIHDGANIPTILENQQEGLGLLFLTPETALTQKYRNEKVFELLAQNGVILV